MTIEITTASVVLARLRARQAVKERIRAYGLKVSAYSARDIGVWAQLFLEDHANELMPDAIARARAMILSGALGKRARAKLLSGAPTQKP